MFDNYSLVFLLLMPFVYYQVKTMAEAQNCLLPMGVTSENVAHRFNVTRQEQDQAAVVCNLHIFFISMMFL